MNDKAYKFSTRDSTEFTVGSGLPEVTAEDNGDVLTVVEGAWAKAAPTGTGSGVMVVDVEYGEAETAGDQPPKILKNTWQEIHDAMVAGTTVIIREIMPESSTPSGQFGAMTDYAISAVFDGTGYRVVGTIGQLGEYTTSSPDGYPTCGGGLR